MLTKALIKLTKVVKVVKVVTWPVVSSFIPREGRQ